MSCMQIRIDSAKCTVRSEGAFLGKNKFYDIWQYRDLNFEGGRIYGIVGEHGQGCEFLSYLLGGKVDFGNLQIYMDGNRMERRDLECVSWNLEPAEEGYKKDMVCKSIKKALTENHSTETFEEIQQKFALTPERANRRLNQLSGERWRASAALGYARGKRIFYAPYRTSSFYYAMSGSGLLKALRELADSGALVCLPVGSDRVMKYIADACMYLDEEYEIDGLRRYYNEVFGGREYIR